jgi:hypothetical protein
MRPRFSAEIIGELRHRVIDHNKATPDPAFHVKLGELKGRYEHCFRRKGSHAQVLAEIDAYLEHQRRQAESSSLTPINPKDPRSRPRMRGVRMFPLVDPHDFGQAIMAAGLSIKPRREDVETAAAVASKFAWDVVTVQLEPSIPTMRRMAGEFGNIVRATNKLVDLLIKPLGALQPTDDVMAELVRRLSNSQDPRYLNLLSSIEAGDESAHGATLFAKKILSLRELADWHQATSDRVMDAVTRERRSRTSIEMRSRPREFGWVLVASYVSLTGKSPGMSRKAPGPHEGKLDGPLIRFLRQMFLCVRQTIERSPEIAGLAEDRVWNPSDEALRAWVIYFRNRLLAMQADQADSDQG